MKPPKIGNPKAKNTLILGIDPGSVCTGYSLINAKGNQEIEILQLGLIHLNKYDSYLLRLKQIYDRMLGILKTSRPDALAIEAPFYGKNVQAMLKLGRIQGIIMGMALHFKIPVTEYAPRKIKSSITGNGNATKEQVAYMLSQIFNISLKEYNLDTTDALSVAICHAMQSQSQPTRHTSWKHYIKDNPDKIQK